MTTGIGKVREVDPVTLKDLLGEAVRGRGMAAVLAPHASPQGAAGAVAHASPQAASHTDAVARAAAPVADSTPESAAFARHLARAATTAAPLLAADFVALALSGLFAELLVYLFAPQAAGIAGRAAPIVLLPLVLGYWVSGLYSEVWVHPALQLKQTTHVTSLGLLAAALAGLWAPPLTLWCVAAWAVAVVTVPLFRALARCWSAGAAWWGFPTLVIGSGSGADALARALIRSCPLGLRPALLTDPEGLCRSSVVPVVNEWEELQSLVRAKGIRHAVLCLPDVPTARVSKTFDQYGELVSHLVVVCEPPPLPALWGAQRVCGLGGVEVRNGLRMVTLRAMKRAADVVLSAIGLVLGLPLLLGIAALVKVTSPGTALYGHRRIGRYGRRFTAWKFRTMHRGADVLLRRYFDQVPSARLEWERDQKLRHDPRVTRVGRVLRTLSLDELPQMWNVLRGEMSLVGPRPIVDEEVCKYGDAFKLYTAVKPGITGLWQVSGRTDIGYETRVRLDEFYVRHWSPWLDAYLVIRTVAALACRRGAY
jgi:Undecaprenyl-phosphate galactose phosphotransferase WbaP